jgi:hypothetical protein
MDEQKQTKQMSKIDQQFIRNSIEINWLVYDNNEPVTGLTELTIEGHLKQVEEIKPGEYKIIE